MSTIQETLLWHQKVRPTPTKREFNTQVSTYFEEVQETIEQLSSHEPNGITALNDLKMSLDRVTKALRLGYMTVAVRDDEKFLKELCDVIVTVVGTAHTAGYDIINAMGEVNASNNSKFVKGQPQFDVNGKVIKGENYRLPDLSGCV